MTPAEAIAAMANRFQEPVERDRLRPDLFYFPPERRVHAQFVDGRLAEIELAGLSSDVATEDLGPPPILAAYRGIDLLYTEATLVLAALDAEAHEVLERGNTINFHQLGMTLWRGDGPGDDGRWAPFFESVLVYSPQRLSKRAGLSGIFTR